MMSLRTYAQTQVRRARNRKCVALLRAVCVSVVLGIGVERAVAALPSAPAVQKPTSVTQQCATEICHPAIVRRKVMHEPVAKEKCLECHQ